MQTLSVDSFAVVFSFLDIDEWYATSSAHSSVLRLWKTFTLRYAPSCIKNRLETFLRSIFDGHFDKFVSCMKESGGIITGSTFLQMLIGEKKFKANDLDIFMCFEPK